MMIQSAREETEKLGGKKGMKPATFKKLVQARLTKEKEDQIALLGAAQEIETPQVEEGSEY